jgi:hypothetical protein
MTRGAGQVARDWLDASAAQLVAEPNRVPARMMTAELDIAASLTDGIRFGP